MLNIFGLFFWQRENNKLTDKENPFKLRDQLLKFGTFHHKTYNLLQSGHNILKLYSVLVQVRFATSKTKLITSLVHELLHELPKYSRLRNLGKIRKTLK